jgi:hypothetical protein
MELLDKLTAILELAQYWFSVLVQRLGWMEDWAENKVSICVEETTTGA